jgi:predicted Zn-dependent protease
MCSIAVMAGACSTVPGTNRSQLNFMSTSQMNRLGNDTFQSILREKHVIERGPDAARVKTIGNRVVQSARTLYQSADLPSEWEIVLIDDETPNAFALPGGRIGVHTGMVQLAGDDDALAIVLAHEVGHVLAEHSAERMSQQVLMTGGLALGAAAMTDQDESTKRWTMAALGVGATVGVLLPYSRLHESESDELGLMIAANAGYDPRAAIPLWQRMAKAGGGQLEFLSTHPVPATRIDGFRRLMPQAMVLYRRARSPEKSRP